MKQKKKGLKKRILALSLAGILCFGSVPQSVYASESSDGNIQETTQSDQISEETADELLQQEENVKEEANGSGTAEDTVTGAEDTVTGETENTEPEIVIPGAVRLKEAATPEDMAEEAKTEVTKHTRLIVVSESDLTECYGATECIRGYGNLHILTYEDATTCENAYAQFTAAGMSVEYDETVEAYEEETEEAKSIEETLEDTNKETKAEEQEKATEEVKEEEKQEIVVAVIDTGADSSSKILKGRIKDNGYIPDTNGHGTLMAEIIASNTVEEVKILPIQAFDENGKGTVSTTYLAIMEAIEKKADIINLSVSGKGTSPMLTSAIRQAKEAGIPVIVSAGNNGADTTDYMPGNITEALTVSAVTEDKESAAYSNHGKEVDFCAIGTVTKDNGTGDTSDDVTYEGTSVSAAYLTAYAAMILKENPQADVEACLKESAEDLGETGWDSLYGYGYISRENIISNIEKEENEESEEENKNDNVTDIVTEEDGGQELAVSADIKNKDFWIYDVGSSVSICIVGIRDSDAYYGGNWNDLGKGNIYYGLYPRAAGGYDLYVTMSCDVTDYTPYLDLTTSKPGYRPLIWGNFVYGGTGMSDNWNGTEVHNWNDYWTGVPEGYYIRQYIGAGFNIDRVTLFWEPVGYHINHDMNGATYIDQNTLNYLNSVEYRPDTLYGVPDSNTFANKYNKVTYDANGGTCVSGNTGGSYDHGYSAFLGWDDNTVINTNNGLLYDCYGYQSTTTFNAAYYANANPDLMAAYGYDKQVLWNHYCNHGVYEGRSIRSGHGANNLDSNDLYVPGGQRAFRNLTDSGKTVTLTARWKDPIVKLPTPTRTGYTFTGWYTASGSCVGKGGDSYTVSGTGTLYARWTPNTYYINYDLNGATSIDEQYLNNLNKSKYTYDTYYNFPYANTFANKYNRVNYDAAGGTCTSNGTGESYDEGYSAFLGWDDNTVINTTSGQLTTAWGYQSTTLFNAAYYANAYPDLMKAFGYDKLALWNHYCKYGVNEGRSIRSGHGLNNLNINDLYYPQGLRAFRNLTTVPGGTVKLLARWKEPVVKLPTPTREGYTFLGWYKEDETYVGKGGDSYTLSGTSTLHAKWKEHEYTLVFDGNGADIGFMESLTVHYTDTLTLPKNLYENTTIPCTYMGWIHDKDALKADYGDEEELEVKKIIKKAGKEAEDGATITLYAFWDHAPEIEAKDWYIGKEMAENMTEEQLLERAKSTDREDEDLERGKELVVVDFDKEDFLHLGQIGSCTVTFQATDSAGNITYKDIKVEVSEDGWLDMPYYIRFISEEFYGKKPESGGCVDGSVWNEIPEYKQELTDAFARIKNDTGVITYVFERDDIKASHDFTEAHGFGKYEEDGALNLWLDAFAHCKQ